MIRSLLTISSLAVLLAAPVLATAQTAAPAAAAAPAADNSKLKGNWNGTWSLPGYGGGKFELMANEVEGASVKGAANWYGTALGDVKAPLTKGEVKDGALNAEQPGGWSFKVSLKGDDELEGTWSVGAYSGPLKLARVK